MNDFNDLILKLVIFTVISALIIAKIAFTPRKIKEEREEGTYDWVGYAGMLSIPLVMGWITVWPPLLGVYILFLGAFIAGLLILGIYQKRKDMIDKIRRASKWVTKNFFRASIFYLLIQTLIIMSPVLTSGEKVLKLCIEIAVCFDILAVFFLVGMYLCRNGEPLEKEVERKGRQVINLWVSDIDPGLKKALCRECDGRNDYQCSEGC